MTEPTHDMRCGGCRELTFLTQRNQAIAAAKAAFAALPAERRAELDDRFNLARLRAQFHAEYVRPDGWVGW